MSIILPFAAVFFLLFEVQSLCLTSVNLSQFAPNAKQFRYLAKQFKYPSKGTI